jgi:hypothetical protein
MPDYNLLPKHQALLRLLVEDFKAASSNSPGFTVVSKPSDERYNAWQAICAWNDHRKFPDVNEYEPNDFERLAGEGLLEKEGKIGFAINAAGIEAVKRNFKKPREMSQWRIAVLSAVLGIISGLIVGVLAEPARDAIFPPDTPVPSAPVSPDLYDDFSHGSGTDGFDSDLWYRDRSAHSACDIHRDADSQLAVFTAKLEAERRICPLKFNDSSLYPYDELAYVQSEFTPEAGAVGSGPASAYISFAVLGLSGKDWFVDCGLRFRDGIYEPFMHIGNVEVDTDAFNSIVYDWMDNPAALNEGTTYAVRLQTDPTSPKLFRCIINGLNITTPNSPSESLDELREAQFVRLIEIDFEPDSSATYLVDNVFASE